MSTRSNLIVTSLAAAGLLSLCACFSQDTKEDAAPAAPPPAPAQPLNAARQHVGGAAPRAAAPRERSGRPGLGSNEVADYVTNPASKAKMAVYVDIPQGRGPFKAVVLVPGGAGNASSVMGGEQKHFDAFLEKDIAIVRFDPDGRGNSEGDDDLAGETHQAGLQAIIAYAVARDDIADDQVGVFSNSYGITMSVGALKGGATDAIFLIDWEGPCNRDYTAGCNGTQGESQAPFQTGISCADEEFWGQREAIDHIAEVKVPYMRIQRAQDHVHKSDSSHAWLMLDKAIDGGVPWVGLNDLQPNQSLATYKKSDLVDVEFDDLFYWFSDWAEDMFVVAEGGTPVARNHVPSASTAPATRPGRPGAGRRPSPGGPRKGKANR